MSVPPTNPIEGRLAALELRVAWMCRRLGLTEDEAVSPAASADQPLPPSAAPDRAAAAEPTPAPSITPKPASAPAPSAASAPVDAEGFFGGRVLLVVGAFVLLLGVGFFIKYAFDNGWIGPAGRVAIGLLAGIALVALGERFGRTGKTVYGGALTGLGGGVLYLSLWGAGNGFHLVPIGVSFVAMAVVTASLIAISVRNNSEATAGFALLGGFITPLLNVTPTPQPFNLLTYVAMLDVALALLPINRRWPRIQAFAFVATQLYLCTTFMLDRPAPLGTVLAFATIYLALFVAQPLRKAVAGIEMSAWDSWLVVVATGAFYFTLHVELFAAHRHWLTAAVVALAATFLGLAQVARSRDRAVLAAVALALITGGVAVTFEGNVVAVLWAVEGALLTWVGLLQDRRVIRAFGYLSLVLGGFDLLAFPPSGGAAFVNERFITFGVLALALFSVRAASAYFRSKPVTELERLLLVASEPAGHICALYALSQELYTLTGHHELSLTLLWLGYAAVLFAVGIARGLKFARWEGLILLSVAILKAFAVDMSALNPGIRIVSFIALGSVTMAISYGYQRYAAKKPENAP